MRGSIVIVPFSGCVEAAEMFFIKSFHLDLGPCRSVCHKILAACHKIPIDSKEVVREDMASTFLLKLTEPFQEIYLLFHHTTSSI